MRWCKWVLPALLAAAFCAQACATVEVTEYSGHYERGVHYDVEPPSLITIYECHEGYVYEFDCYDCVANGPCVPAEIQSITAVPGVGNIEIKICEHLPDRLVGASDVGVFFPPRPGVTVTVKRFNIAGSLGDLGQPTYIDAIDGEFWAGGLANDLHVGRLPGVLHLARLTSDLYVTGLQREGTICVFDFAPLMPHSIEVTGSVCGIYLGDEYSSEARGVNASVSISGDADAINILHPFGLSGHIQVDGRLWNMMIAHPRAETFPEPPIVIHDFLGEVFVPSTLTGSVQIFADRFDGLLDVYGGLGPSALLQIETSWAMLADVLIEGGIQQGGVVEISGTPVYGQVVVAGDVAGAVKIPAGIGLGGSLHIAGGLTPPLGTGLIATSRVELGAVQGAVQIDGDVYYDGGIEVGGVGDTGSCNLAGNLAGHLCADSLSGLIDVTGHLGETDPNHPFAGAVRVYGGLVGTAKVWVHSLFPGGGLMGPSSYVAV